MDIGSILVGVVSGVAATALAGVLSHRRDLWQQRRHDYGELLLVLRGGSSDEILARMELVILVAPKAVRERADRVRAEILKMTPGTSIPTEARERWRSELLNVLCRQLQPGH